MRLDEEIMLAIGVMALSLALVFEKFVQFDYEGFAVANFFEGIFIGLALVMSFVYLIRKTKH
ncbi:MAG: hypothetical protein NWF04_05300 [Candidatus Bathyarchaeota archaeon]|nr:hypothetical protein [Candidatus Bathyarchaeota archaeon]